MASAEELRVRKLLEEAVYFWNNRENDQTYVEKARSKLDEADAMIRCDTRIILDRFSSQILVILAETALKIEEREQVVESYLDMYFQLPASGDQFQIRALFAYAQIQGMSVQLYKSERAIAQVKKAFSFIQKGLDILLKPENKSKYSFLIYNASVSAWRFLRPMIRPNFGRSVIEAVEKISGLLEEIDYPEIPWRVRYLQALCNCYHDADKKPEAQKAADKLWDLTKRKGNVEFQETLWRLRVHLNKENAGAVGALRKESESTKGDLKYHIVLQQIRSGGIPDAQVEKELMALLQTKPASEGLAEASRVALQYNLLNLAKNILESLTTARQPSLRARIWAEYSKAELMVKQNPEKDAASGIKLTLLQQKKQELDRRIEALKLLERVMVANKRLNDPGVMSEGCILIWNIGKPLLTPSMRQHTYKAFLIASSFLEALDSPLHELRISLYLELARFELQQDFIAKAEAQISKAYKLDPSLLKVNVALTDQEDPGDFLRPLDRHLSLLKNRIKVKKNIYKDPENMIEQAILDIQNAKHLKGGEEDLLKRALSCVLQEEPYDPPITMELVEEEKQERERTIRYTNFRNTQQRHLLAGEIASIAVSSQMFSLASEACEFVLSKEWDPSKYPELVANQAEVHYNLARIIHEELKGNKLEAGYSKDIALGEAPIEEGLSTDRNSPDIMQKKTALLMHVKEGVRLASAANQPWLSFNGGALLWNIYLPVFSNTQFERHVLPELTDTLRSMVDTYNTLLEKIQLVAPPGSNLPFNRTVDFEYSEKIYILSELAIILIRLYLHNNALEDAQKISEAILTKPLGPRYRKDVEKLRGTALALRGQPAKAQPTSVKPTESVTSEVLNLMESAKAMSSDPNKKSLCTEALKRANTLLSSWNPDSEESDLTLHAELWARLGRQMFDIGDLHKLALLCAHKCLMHRSAGNPDKKRLCWYSVGEFFYGQVLLALIDPKKQEAGSQFSLRESAITHFVQAAGIGMQSGVNKLVLDAGRALFNAVLDMEGRFEIIQPMLQISAYLIELKDTSDPDFLIVFYKALIDAIITAEMWAEGEKLIDQAFLLVPATHQKTLWEAQMLMYSKQGKNASVLLGRMKESNPLLQARVLVKYARTLKNHSEIDSTYLQAVQTLKGHVESSEILLEWAIHQHSRGMDVTDKLVQAADSLLDIERAEIDDGASVSSSSIRSQVRSLHSMRSLKSKTSNVSFPTKRSKLGSVDEPEGNPEKLNITHLDRLVRIYAMLAELTTTIGRKKRYALQSISFIERILKSAQDDPQAEVLDWSSFSLSEEKISELSSADSKEVFCKDAFERKASTHIYVRKLVEWLDEELLYHKSATCGVIFLEYYSRLVLRNSNLAQIYISWKYRILKKMCIEVEASNFKVKEETRGEYRDMIAYEVMKRGEFKYAEDMLKGTESALGKYILAELASIEGLHGKALRYDQECLNNKSIATLKFVPRIGLHLIKAKKIEETHLLYENTLNAINSSVERDSLTVHELRVEILLASALLHWDESSKLTKSKEERTKHREKVEEYLQLLTEQSQSQGLNALHFYSYLSLFNKLKSNLESKLIHHLSKEKLPKKINFISNLYTSLELLLTIYRALFDAEMPEARMILSIILWKQGELIFLEHKIRQELLSRFPNTDIVNKYLQELENQIDLEKRGTQISLLSKARTLLVQAEDLAINEYLKQCIRLSMIECDTLEGIHIDNIEFPTDFFAWGYSYKLEYLRLANAMEVEKSIEHLIAMQWVSVRENMMNEFLSLSSATHRDRLLIDLMLSTSVRDMFYRNTPGSYITSLSNSVIWKLLDHKFNFSELKDKLNPNTGCLIIQYEKDLSYVWAAFYALDRDRNTKLWFTSSKISIDNQYNLENLLAKHNELKTLLHKSTIVTEEDLSSLTDRAESYMHEILSSMESEFAWLSPINDILVPPADINQLPEDPKKKPPPKKDEKVLDLGLPTPSSGISTLLLSIDSRFIELPFESLELLKSIPIVTRDFSIVNHDFRIRGVSSLSKDTLKYVVEEPIEPIAKEEHKALTTELTAAKWDRQTVTGDGQWERIVAGASLLLNIHSDGVDTASAATLSCAGGLRNVICIDKINTLKKFMTKMKTRDNKNEILFTLLGSPCILVNTWALQPLSAYSMARFMCKGLMTSQILGVTHYNYKNSVDSLVMKHNFKLYGLPLIKL